VSASETTSGAPGDTRARSVTLVDLRPNADSFMGGASVERARGRLAKAGHAVSLVRATRDVRPEDGGDEARWSAEIAREVGATARASGADFVVVWRAWSEALIDRLREAAGDARLIRLGSIAAALDDRFDAVVDEEGLLALVSGLAPPPKRSGPLRPGDLRKLAATPEGAGAPSQDAGARPTLTGPAVGCPFLLDARKNPRFAGLTLDERVQTRGCTFCLDNLGTYAMPSEPDVLAAWLGQLRALRASRPDTREVLLVDERPHPFLPALFAAIEGEPALHGLTLLVKSRVDWLLEFAEHVTRAIELAARSGSVLDLYLVGFESFDAAQLELFNKGVTVDDNLRAIALMRSLGARYPASFAFDRHRAHGIVLFTPWTTPASLLENARVMREVRFHELRTEAIRTRLRLYARTPLHALAASEGLLVDTFAEGRPDRAAEQGYDASVPWRFADARVEAIFQAATGLAARHRDVRDADALELATRLVLAREALASAPESAYAPLVAAVSAHGARASLEVARVLADATFAALGASQGDAKRASEGRVVEAADAPALVEAAGAMGFVSQARACFDGRARVVVAREARALEAAMGAKPATLPSALRVGARVRAHRIAALASEAHAHRLVIERPGGRVVLVIAPTSVAGPCALRRGAFGVEIENPATLDDDDRVAIGQIVRALPA
jgi:hypothetical protein